MVQIEKDAKSLSHDILDYLELSVKVSESNLVNSSENAGLVEANLFSALD